MSFLHYLETHPMPYSPITIGEHENNKFIGITRAHVLTLGKDWGNILHREKQHVLSMNAEYLEYNGKDEEHIFAFIYAENAKFLRSEKGPQMYLRALCLQVN